jgi:hypothetical protein
MNKTIFLLCVLLLSVVTHHQIVGGGGNKKTLRALLKKNSSQESFPLRKENIDVDTELQSFNDITLPQSSAVIEGSAVLDLQNIDLTQLNSPTRRSLQRSEMEKRQALNCLSFFCISR